MKKNYIANPVIGRLPRYYRCVSALSEAGVLRVSSSELAEKLGLTASQIRQDFGCFGEFGQKGYGYHVPHLLSQLSGILGLDQEQTAIILGCGNMGRALINNFHFSFCGVRLIGAYDNNPQLIGQEINGMTIQDHDDIHDLMRTSPPDIAILTVPNGQAQYAAEVLAQEGIRGIWNFTMDELSLPGSKVVVENMFMSDSLMSLSYRINNPDPF